MTSLHRCLAVAISGFAPLAFGSVVDFNNVGLTNLPYSENGLNFTNTGQTDPVVFGGVDGDGYLASGTNFLPIRILVTGDQPFDLESISIESVFRT
ncbi:MAG: hypothetical protein AAGB29_10305 [Planctomycetota bacterium]